MLQIVNTINSYLSDYILVFLLVAVGLWYTVKTKCVQRYLWKGLKQLFGGFSLRGGSQGGGMSSFQAVATAIAAQVGTGNIVGSAGAILVGGPGAIFWMWIIAFLGMATIYAEATLAQKTRVTDAEGNIQGGPVYYIQTAFKGKFGTFLAGFFSIAIILALGFFGCMVQSNSIGSTILYFRSHNGTGQVELFRTDCSYCYLFCPFVCHIHETGSQITVMISMFY